MLHFWTCQSQNSALQNEILGLQERVRNTSAERSDAVRIDVFSSVAQSNLEAEVRKARNEMEFIKKQVWLNLFLRILICYFHLISLSE